jgi:predicted PurR-regulated permease PerM
MGGRDVGRFMVRIEVRWQQLLLAASVLLGAFLLWRVWQVVLIVAAAFIFMAALLPYVEWLVRRGLPRIGAVLLIFAAITAGFAGMAALVIPAGVDEFQELHDNLPEHAKQLEDFLADFGIDVELEQRARDVDWGELISGREAVDYGQRAFVGFISFLSIMVITAYLLLDAPGLSRFVYQFVPPGREPQVERILEALSRVVGGYVRGQFITSVAIALYVLVVLLALGVPNAVAFAIVAAFADLIPIVGAYISTILPMAAAFDESPGRAAVVLVAMIIYQQIEDRILIPRVYGSTLNLPPIIVLVAVLVGGELLGVAGVLFALPAAAAARVGVDMYLESRRPGPSSLPGPSGDPVAPDLKEET